jgi:esterase/lipase
MKRRKIVVVVYIVAALAIAYCLGPEPARLNFDNHLPEIKMAPTALEQKIAAREAEIKNIKPGNQSRIVWYDSIQKNKTPYCIVYLHGFSASPQEGAPVHTDIARKFGCNLYLPRLYAHGLDEAEPLLALDEEHYLASAKEAVAEALNLGEKVIIMGTSTGCTFALYLASGNPDIAGLLLYSPNIELRDPRSFLLAKPWGLQLARTIMGSKYYSAANPAGKEKYWTTKYRIEAIVHLNNLLQYTMTKEIFHKIKQPVLMCYYYKNEKEQDDVVSVPAMLKMYDELGTVSSLKRKVVVPNAGTHVITSGSWSHDIYTVENETASFMENVLRMNLHK